MVMVQIEDKTCIIIAQLPQIHHQCLIVHRGEIRQDTSNNMYKSGVQTEYVHERQSIIYFPLHLNVKMYSTRAI